MNEDEESRARDMRAASAGWVRVERAVRHGTNDGTAGDVGRKAGGWNGLRGKVVERNFANAAIEGEVRWSWL